MANDTDANGWRPIASAPRDGAELLVCATHSLGDGEWETVTWVDWALGEVVWPNYRNDFKMPFPPTHWQPLPNPPVTETEA